MVHFKANGKILILVIFMCTKRALTTKYYVLSLGWLDLLAIQELPVSNRATQVWMAMPLCLMWSLWNERNQCTFDGIERPVSILKENLLRTLFTWSHVFGVISSTSFLDFIDSLSLWTFYLLVILLFWNEIYYLSKKSLLKDNLPTPRIIPKFDTGSIADLIP